MQTLPPIPAAMLLLALLGMASARAQDPYSTEYMEERIKRTTNESLRSAEIERLQRENDSLSAYLKASHDMFEDMMQTCRNEQLEARYRYIREQVELKRYLFCSNGVVLPGYSDIVKVTVKSGKITGITILLVEGDGKPDYLEMLFSDSALTRGGYENTRRSIVTGYLRLARKPYISPRMMQIPRLRFPSLLQEANSQKAKQHLAQEYMAFIRKVSNSRDFRFNVEERYLELERKMVLTSNIDDQISLRRKFILYLREDYEKRHSHK